MGGLCCHPCPAPCPGVGGAPSPRMHSSAMSTESWRVFGMRRKLPCCRSRMGCSGGGFGGQMAPLPHLGQPAAPGHGRRGQTPCAGWETPREGFTCWLSTSKSAFHPLSIPWHWQAWDCHPLPRTRRTTLVRVEGGRAERPLSS